MRPFAFVHALFPPPRRAVTWRGVMPLVVFLVLFAALVLVLEMRGVLRFTRPNAFWFMAVAPWFWWMHQAGGSGLSGVRGVVALVVRLMLVALFVLLLAENGATRRRCRVI